MERSKDMLFAKTHEWMLEENGECKVGITDFAQQQLGSLVYVNLPEVGDEVTAGEAFCDVESVKSDSDIIAPVSGTVTKINEELLDSPELVNQDPYSAWFIKIENAGGTEELLDAAAYEEACAQEEA